MSTEAEGKALTQGAFPRPWQKDGTNIGTTLGLAAFTCSRDERKVEQAYVSVIPGDHPVVIDGWVGYSSLGRMCFTKQQATELIGLLAQAVAR
jgi:hypothetical protein